MTFVLINGRGALTLLVVVAFAALWTLSAELAGLCSVRSLALWQRPYTRTNNMALHAYVVPRHHCAGQCVVP